MSWLVVVLAVLAIWVALSVLVVLMLCTISTTNERALELEREYVREQQIDFELHGFSVRCGDGDGDAVIDLDAERGRRRAPAALDVAHNDERRGSW